MEPTPPADLFEVMGTARAMRHLRPDPVPQEMIDRLLWAATRAPSPGNTQGWEFVVVDDPALRARIGEAVRETLAPRIAAMPRTSDNHLVIDGANHLAEHFAEAPLLVFVCGRDIYPEGAPRADMTAAAMYPAAQNLLLAARAMGLGAVFTTFHHSIDGTLRELLGIPDDVRIGVTMPIGFPAREFGPVRRHPVEGVTHRNGW
jgi:nitroreductase